MKEKTLRESTLIFSGNSTFIQEIYRKYLKNPASVSDEWQEYFANVGDDIESLKEDFDGASWQDYNLRVVGAASEEKSEKKPKDPTLASHENYKIGRLLNRYRRYGHYAADLDPLQITKPEFIPVLTTEYHDISAEDLNIKFDLPYEPNFSNKTGHEIVEKLNDVYCSKIAYEFEYISNVEEKLWLSQRIENDGVSVANISADDKKAALTNIHRAASFEQMLHKKFPGAKRFSVEGGDVSIAALEKIIDLAGASKIDNIELGMAHRGRLNVLTNICDKPYDQMIAEFKGASSIPSEFNAAGDVKYHMGYSTDRPYGDHNVHVALAYNPSHLEAVNPVVAGKVRAKQDIAGDVERKNSVSVLIHGDAAFIGQGSVAESLNMAYVDANYIGGTIHLIINNQIGFTANNTDSRSTRYSSDIAKVIEAPIIHVNGDEVESVLHACMIAFEYRQAFGKDIVLDIVCYRKYGHNEGDEPNYTQPLMYDVVKKMQSLDDKYAAKLISNGVISEEDYAKIKSDRHAVLEDAFKKSDDFEAKKPHAFDGEWKNLTTKEKSKKSDVKTGIDKKILSKNVEKLLSQPENFNANRKIVKQLEQKKQSVKDTNKIDWALGESLAYAGLLQENHPVRIIGQDAKRGTFSHRHSVLRDSNTEEEYIPLNHLFENQAKYEVADSVLSEYAVLGFEHGYSLANPNALTIWEAQFGDFANGAQIIFDQFIASSESKWLRMSGLVMLLPHGYEGQGPEHSSARLERYLQSCAEDNIQVANLTIPANFFHILRRQLHRDYRKPLVIMSPKSLLRHKLAISDLSELDKNTSFKPVISETEKLVADDKVRKLIFCTGKIYYDLWDAREAAKINDVAIVRIEELYPYHEKEISAEVKKYKNAEIIWCQEESENMGAWNFIDRRLEQTIRQAKVKADRPIYVGREASASPATGYMSVHVKEQKALLDKALS